MVSEVIYPEPIESAIAQLESWWQNLGVGAASLIRV
jgi:ferrous iron transport protein B